MQHESTGCFECECGHSYELRWSQIRFGEAWQCRSCQRIIQMTFAERRAVEAERACGFGTEEQRCSDSEGGMTFFGQRKVQAAAYEWKREREWQLQMEIEIEAALLRDLRTQLAELRSLEGTDLTLRFLCETPEELTRTMRRKHTWWEEMKALWMGHRPPEKIAA